VRKYQEHILNVISPMLNSSLKCFRAGTLEVKFLTLFQY